MRRALTLLASGISCTLLASAAFAQPTPEQSAEAHALFEEGRVAMKAGDYAGACPKLERSQRLDPGVGTLYNLATCYEGENRLASAWKALLEVADESDREQRSDRAAVARDRAHALEARVPHLHVTIEGGERPALTLDGRSLSDADVGTNVPIDPGDHEVGADAPGKKHWSSHLVAKEGETATITVPPLEDAATAPEVPAPAAPEPTPPITASPPSLSPAGNRWQMPAALAAGGAGVLALGAGAVLGVLAIGKWSDAKGEGCTQDAAGHTNCPTSGAYSSWSTAHAEGIASTVAFIVGGALVATGALLWFTKPDALAMAGVRADGVFFVGGRLP